MTINEMLEKLAQGFQDWVRSVEEMFEVDLGDEDDK